jgi:hypothetical protein
VDPDVQLTEQEETVLHDHWRPRLGRRRRATRQARR